MSGDQAETGMRMKRLLPWVAGLLTLLWALAAVRPGGRVRGFDVDAFGRLPVLEGGRVKPLDSVARNALLMIRGKQGLRHEGRTLGADEWALGLMFRPEEADRQPVFVIDDPDVLGLLGLRQSTNRYYSFETLAPHLGEIQKQAQAAETIDPRQRTRFQGAVATLFERVYLYYRLKNTLQLAGTGGLAEELANLGHPASRGHQEALVELALFRPLPPLLGQGREAWKSVGEALRDSGQGSVHPLLVPMAKVGAAYTAGQAEAFNGALAELRARSAELDPQAQARADGEMRFNRAQPFYLGMVAYVVALLCLFVSWLWKPEFLQPLAFSQLVAAALIHTTGLAYRIVLQGRPPVTNLYSSAVFVGWAAVVLGILLERMYRRGFATAVAAAAGFASLLIAHHLSMEGDTLEMMRAVLDSNFWLGTHVVTITIGYSGTFLAGAIAIGYTFWKHLAPDPDPESGRVLLSMTYGILCFALFFSFVGTVLGGIWADQSWGRFWGWDPKENGALLIVLWNAIILHARWAGYVRERGIMAMAIAGDIVTSLSWFGVNLLGVGLHSYGFTNNGFWWLMGFILSQALLIVLCLLPRRASAPEAA